MKTNLLRFLAVLISFYLTSCSYNALENAGLIKKKANEYSVARKAPLEMPPDMYLRPPEEEIRKNLKVDIKEKEQMSLDDILAGKNTKKNKYLKKTNQELSKQQRILSKILNIKARVILK